MQQKVKCFYHDDMDGVCSAQIVKMKHPEAECFPVDYERGFPWEIVDKNDLVYMVDYGLQPFDKMIELNSKCNLVWIDHHKTAIEAYNASGVDIAGYRDLHLAGCEITWQYLFPDEDIPIYVQLLADYDTWRRDDMITWRETIEPFEIAMLSFPEEEIKPGAKIWNELNAELAPTRHAIKVFDLIQKGKTIVNFLKKQDAEACKKYAHEVMIGGYCFIALNTPHRGSHQVESVYDTTKYDGVCIYRWSGSEYTFSLYSTNSDVNCGKICKHYGGGGHIGAAGGRWTKEQFAKLFYNKEE